MTTTTLNNIRKHRSCSIILKKLLSYLGKTEADDEPLSFTTILESNGLDDTIWCLRALPDSELRNIQIFALRAANTVHHLMTDKRSTYALDVAQRYLDGNAATDELRAAAADAYDAAYDAAYADDAARAYAAARDAAYAAAYAAARAAAYAADATYDAARAAAYDAARDAAYDADAASAAAYDAAAAYAAARADAYDAARADAYAVIEEIFKEIFC